jgi:hypothetical protein
LYRIGTTNAFSASVRGKVICTVALVGDGEMVLPMESSSFEEVDAARRGARRRRGPRSGGAEPRVSLQDYATLKAVGAEKSEVLRL